MARFTSTCALTMLVLIASGGEVAPQTTPSASPDQIEEDWKVVIGDPDPAGAGPQISVGMCPTADDSTPSFYFNLNYRDSPSAFQAGGMQVQVWSGTSLLASTSKGTAQCTTNGETITWTQRMALSGGSLAFTINNGQSTTWGQFGQGQSISVGGNFSTNLSSLSNYSPATSISKSVVGWESNRVTSMTLVAVRYYSQGQLIATDTTPRSVDLSVK